jgi:hypothetical protein
MAHANSCHRHAAIGASNVGGIACCRSAGTNAPAVIADTVTARIDAV